MSSPDCDNCDGAENCCLGPVTIKDRVFGVTLGVLFAIAIVGAAMVVALASKP